MINNILSVAQQFAGSMPQYYPESVIYGLSKLLLMDERTIRNIFQTSQVINELNSIRFFFEERKMDLYLLKIGLIMCIPYIPGDEEEIVEAYDEYRQYLLEINDQTKLIDVVSKSFDYAYIPLDELFAKDKSSAELFAFIDDMKSGKFKYMKKASVKPNDESVSLPEEKREDTVIKSEENTPFYKLYDKYCKMTASLLECIRGQDNAILKFVEGCYFGEVLEGQEKVSGPKAIFFFFGPPGVGKTYLAETAAKTLNVSKLLLNMAEYTRDEDKDDLVGVSDFYKNAREGILVEFVENNPECLLIFDEIEKASQNVIRVFLQMLSAGSVYNVFRKHDTDFSKAIVVFTSNAGRSLYENSEENLSAIPESVLLSALLNEKDKYGTPVFPSEICSRLATGTTIIFNHIKVRDLIHMVRTQFEKTSELFEKQYGCHISYDDNLSRLFLFSQGTALDARIATSKSINFFKSELYELLRQQGLSELQDYRIKSVEMMVDLSGADQDVRKLFINLDRTEYMVFADEKVIDIFPNNEHYLIDGVSSYADTRKYLKHEIEAIFIDPLLGWNATKVTPLSVTDYDTEGIRLFHDIIESQSGIPVYILDTGRRLSKADVTAFIQEGAVSIVDMSENFKESFARQFSQIAEELYMEKQKGCFIQRGWVLDYRSKQELGCDGNTVIVFYDLKKRMAIDAESRSALLKATERPKVRFKDVIGAENAKAELKYFIEYLTNPKQFLVAGGKPPKGVLLYGPSGTGKTMLAKAMAGESDVAFLQTSASEFKDKYVGGGEANIRRLFKTAKQYAPSIIFIDEIDAIGKKRTGSENTATTESMLNALLTEMDGFSSEANLYRPVFVLAATNYGVDESSSNIASLDEALIRRFDSRIRIDLPNKDERCRYIRVILSNKKIDDITDTVVNNLADRTAGQSLAILQNILDLAFRNAVKNKRTVLGDDLLNALEDFLYGEKREHTPDYYWEAAVHETGHALISYLEGSKPSYITIESRGNYGGYMQFERNGDIGNLTKDMLIGRIRICLAGRAAENVFFGSEKSMNTGAASDLKQASDYAFGILCAYGMEKGQYFILTKEEMLRSPMAEKYVDRINEIIGNEMEHTISVIKEQKELVDKIAKELFAKNHLTGDEFTMLVYN